MFSSAGVRKTFFTSEKFEECRVRLRHGRLRRAATGVLLALASITISNAALAQQPVLAFPVRGQNPYTAKIITVVDHAARGGFYVFSTSPDPTFPDLNAGQVEAYTGELGIGDPYDKKCGSGKPCGFFSPPSSPGGNPFDHFVVTGGYEGAPGDTDPTTRLNYRGHPGYDYGFAAGSTEIVAPADGDLYVPAHDTETTATDPWCSDHIFYIKHGNVGGWTTWYLHDQKITVAPLGSCYDGVTNCCNQTSRTNPISQDEWIAHVSQNQVIATVGRFAGGDPTGVGAHLHFEVRRTCDFSTGAVNHCLVVDPYGWESPNTDPLGTTVKNQNETPVPYNRFATTLDAPLWDKSLYQIHVPVVNSATVTGSPGSWVATVAGQNFDSDAVVTLWDRVSGYFVTNVKNPLPTNGGTQITAPLPGTVSDPGSFVLKVVNPVAPVPVNGDPQGPRSRGTALSVSTPGVSPSPYSSAPLVLVGQPIPGGGGTFTTFNGFWGITNTGPVIFSAGVDSNGDGLADYFSDFSFGLGSSAKMAVSGFNTISNSSLHVRINNSGDLAFGDINGTKGGQPATIYLLKSGASTPIPVVQWGQACGSACPSAPTLTLTDLIGPLAISEAGDIVFSANLNGATPYGLFLYSALSNSLVRVAFDGESTPLGGTFLNGFLDGRTTVAVFASQGDVVFTGQVSGGTSSAGIFRYSRAQGTLSKVVAQGDSISAFAGATMGALTIAPIGSVTGNQLVFLARVSGASTAQIVAVKGDLTSSLSSDVKVVAYQGEATGTAANGTFSDPNPDGLPNVPFSFSPSIRSDGGVVFYSLLTGAVAQNGSSSRQGIFLWNGRRFQKLAVDGDPTSGGKTLDGTEQPITNDFGKVFYFVAHLL